MTGSRYPLASLVADYPPLAADAAGDRVRVEVEEFEALTADDLGLDAFDPIRSVIDHPAGNDGSRDTLRCAGDMVRDGRFTDAQIVGVLMHEDNAVSAHIYRQQDPRRAALRVLSKVRSEMVENGEGEAARRGAGSNSSRNENGAAAPSLPLIDPAEWEGVPVSPRRYVVQGLFLAASVAGLTGHGAVGKSLLAQQIITAIAAGVPVLGLDTAQGSAAYITAEDDVRELHERQVAICGALNVKLPDLSGRLHLASLIDLEEKALVHARRDDRITRTALFHSLRATIIERRLRCVALDNNGHLFGGDENNRAQVVSYLAALSALALETDCAIILISHPNKSGATYSGVTAWQNQIRVQAHLSKPDNDPDSNVRELRLEKANYSPPGEAVRMLWHHGAFRLEDDVPADDSSRVTALQMRQNDIFRECLEAATAREQAASPAKTSSNYAPKLFARMPEARGMSAADFERTMERLFSAGMIGRGHLPFNRSGSRNRAEGLVITQRGEGHDEAPM